MAVDPRERRPKPRSTRELTLNYRTLMSMPFPVRDSMVKSGILENLQMVLTPGQRVALFPTYYKQGFAPMSSQRSSFGGQQTAALPPGKDFGKQRALTPSEKKALAEKGVDTSSAPQSPSTLGPRTPLYSRESIAESAGVFTPREREVLNFISRREGSTDPNTIFGGERYKAALGLDKRPLTERTVSEVLNDIMPKLRELSQADGFGKNNKGKVVGTSAVGTGQMIEGTLKANLTALGIPEKEWGNIKFDKTLQEKLTLQNFKSSGIGDPNASPNTWDMTKLGEQYESLNVSRGFKPMSKEEMQRIATASPELLPKDTAALMKKDQPAIGTNVGEGGEIVLGSTSTIVSRSPKGAMKGVDQRMQVVGDAAIRSFEQNNPGYTVRVISGIRPGSRINSSKLSKHATGEAIDYEIIGPDGKALPSLGDPTHGSRMGVGERAGDSAPKYFELMKNMEAARVKMGEKDPSYIDMGRISPGLFFKGGAWMDSMHASFGEGGALGDIYSGFKSPEQLRAEGTDPQIVRAVERAIKAGAPVQGQGEPLKEEDMKAYAEALFGGKGTQSSQIAQAARDSESLLGLAAGSDQKPTPVKTKEPTPAETTQTQPATPASAAGQSAQATQQPAPVQTASLDMTSSYTDPLTAFAGGGVIEEPNLAVPLTNVASAEGSPTKTETEPMQVASLVPKTADQDKSLPSYYNQPITAFAGGGEITQPHMAVPLTTKGDQSNKLIAETGPEKIMPRHKINAGEVGQQSYQLPMLQQQQTSAMSQQAAQQQTQEKPTEVTKSESPTQPIMTTGASPRPMSVVAVDHPIMPPTARKAYADAKLEPRYNNLSPIGAVYTNHNLT